MEGYDFSVIKKNLEKKGYEVSLFKNRQETRDYLDEKIDKITVGIGGSETVNQLGVFSYLSNHNEVFWHWQKKGDLSPDDIRRAAGRARVYLCSVNAISEDGYIVNIDGSGNRVSTIAYGAEKVFLIVGRNKISKNLEEAIFRARNIAAPLNAKRLKLKTPCALKGDSCYDCKSPERICRIFEILACKPNGAEYEILFIDEDLGF